VHALRELGYVQAKNLVLDIRSAEGRVDRFPEIARELVRLKADVILSSSNAALKAARDVTQTVPIVMVGGSSPVEEGLVQSLARPGGNITGLTVDAGPDLGAKRLELLKELLPKASRVAVPASKGDWVARWELSTQAAATVLGVRLLVAEHRPRFWRHFLLTSLAGAAPAHMLGPAVVEPAEAKREPRPAPEPFTHAETLWGLANELQNLSHIVEGYSQLMLQDMDEADRLRHAPLALLKTGQQLSELIGHLRALAGGIPPGRPMTE
jgi:ABC transporter substrate binding protein